MTTAVWVILSVAGLIVGFVAGYGRRRRRASAIAAVEDAATPVSPRASHPSTRSPREPDTEPTEPEAPAPRSDDGVVVDAAFGVGRRRAPHDDAPEGQVIDLRRPPATEPSTESGSSAAEPTARQESPARDPAGPEKDPTTAPTATLTAASAPHDAAEPTPTPTPGADVDPTADIIDLRDRISAPVPVHNLQFVRGIGPAVDLALRRQGIVTLADLASLDRAAVERVATEIEGVSAKRLRTKLRARAREMLTAAEQSAVAEPPDTSGLRQVQGIGATMARWLETHDIIDLESLAALDREEVDRLESQLIDHPGRIRAQRWVKQARELLAADQRPGP